ncbi:4Fe-4S binding protein [Clostridium sp. Cult3]|uniref:4Fe-4S binding protein n=1 Tax=Clostridium sp. Cult3 TaxID=2079004 RepID=UPI001F32553C|nr:4Fe-4S binding protein [Clostridium sp. Cult3]MCF6461607.1 polyferredoxin [Clostridium sp. Cult3]
MKLKKRSLIQIAISGIVITNCIIYYLYIIGFINWKALSIGDINPYGGWSALKSAFTDVSYRWTGISKSIALTIGIMVTALLMGRFFCGFICPIGAFQDFFKYLGTKLGIKERKLPRGERFKPETIKYFVLITVLVLSILGLGNLITPYSPWLAYLNLFMGINLQIGSIVLLFIAVSSIFYKRIFCRILCPLGAFQSLLSAIGLSKINSNEKCNRCTYCLNNCPVDIGKPDEGEISPECIRCMECVEGTCIKDTKGYSLKYMGLTVGKKQYITISLILFVGIFILLPILDSKVGPQSTVQIGNLKDGVFVGTGVGFGGPMQVEIKVEDNRIFEINPINHRETAGYYEEVFRTISREVVHRQSLNIDTISGATATSRGFLNAIKSGISQALEK